MIAARLFIACAYGPMASRGLRPVKSPCFPYLTGVPLFLTAQTPGGGPDVPVLVASQPITLAVAGMLEILHAERQEALARAGHSSALALVISSCYLDFGGVSAAGTSAVRTRLLLPCRSASLLPMAHFEISFHLSLSSLLVLLRRYPTSALRSLPALCEKEQSTSSPSSRA